MANGNFAGGDGTPENPYLIEDAFDLDAVRNDLSAHYKLIKDIDFDGEEISDIIGFKGVLDGGFKEIRGLHFKQRYALFRSPNGAVLKNLKLIDVIHGNSANTGTAVLISLMEEGSSATVLNCKISVTAIDPGQGFGAIVGKKNPRSNNLVIENVVVDITIDTDVEISQGCIGGLIGSSSHTDYTVVIKNCSVQGELNCPNMGRIGGLIGFITTNSNYRKKILIEDSYFAGKIVGSSSVGGILGYSTSLNDVSMTVKSVFWDSDLFPTSGVKGATELTTQQMQTAQTFIDAGWDKEVLEDGTPVWQLKDGKYPKLWFEVERYNLLKQSNEIFYFDGIDFINTSLVEPLSQQDFEQYGMGDISIIPKEKWAELGDTFEVITWTDSDKSPNVNLTIPETKPIYLFNDPEVLTWTDSEFNEVNLQVVGHKNLTRFLIFEKPKLLIYDTSDRISNSCDITGILNNNYYRYKVEVNDTSTPNPADKVLVPMTDWLTTDISDSVTVPAGFVDKMNPYEINVIVEQYNNTLIQNSGEVKLYNTAPYIIGDLKGLKLNLTLGDDENDKIQYQVKLNGEKIYPSEAEWSDMFTAPYTTDIYIDSSKIKYNINNEIAINVRDQFGLTGDLLLTFVGDYFGLMFVDGDGNYYSSDKGDLIKYLDFGIIVAGQVSHPAGVLLKNNTGYDLANIRLFTNKTALPSGSDVQISRTETPFIPEDTIVINQLMDKSSIPFYVRILTDIDTESGGSFEILTKADPM